MGRYIIYTVNGAHFVPYCQVKVLDAELQELKMANKNLQNMLNMVLRAKGGQRVSEDADRGSDN